MRHKDYQGATQTYLKALDLISAVPATAKLRQQTIDKLSTAAIRYAHELIQKSRYSDAKKVVAAILLPQYQPNDRSAIRLLSKLQKNDSFEHALIPNFAEDQNKIARLLIEAEDFYSTNRLDLAQKRYEEILHIDPYNMAAKQGEKRLHRRKEVYYQRAFLENRSHLLGNVTRSWERPLLQTDSDAILQNSNASGTEEIRAKLNKILLPKVEFRETTVSEAIDFLKQRAKELDSTPGGKGINIVLKHAKVGPSLSTHSAGKPTQENISFPSTKIDLTLTNIPLYEALRYVSELAGLKLNIEPYAVSIVPASMSGDQFLTKEYRILPSFLPAQPVKAAFDLTNEKKKIWVRMGAQEYLQSQGVPFPNGASANYVSAGSRLIVRNTPDALNLIDSIVAAANRAAPLQVQIESKFINISQNNLKEMGFDWLLGPVSLPTHLALSGGGASRTHAAHYPMVNPATGFPIGRNPVTDNLRAGSGGGPKSAISTHSISSLIAQSLGAQWGGAASVFGISGIFTRPQFQMVIRALSQTKGVDLVSAPKVTARSGQKATIKIIRTFPYPTEFHPPQIPQKGIVAPKEVLTNNAFVSQIVTPTTPSRFEVRNTGVTMEVEPIVGPDGMTIDLNLSPEVVEFDGFINYGVPILGIVNQAVTGIPAPTVLTENTIHQPIFSTRKVTTSVSIWDGQTVALGGLMREDTQKVEDKIPFLGDIPLMGRLFRSYSEQKIKDNLIIFVTARLIDAQGNPIRPEEEKEEIRNPQEILGALSN